jgi:hypothetical protein
MAPDHRLFAQYFVCLVLFLVLIVWGHLLCCADFSEAPLREENGWLELRIAAISSAGHAMPRATGSGKDSGQASRRRGCMDLRLTI